MIVTIDGPAGAGKSTVARALAHRLGFRYLDTGAMYRTVALAGLRRDVDWNDPRQLAALAPQLNIVAADQHILLDGEDVTDEIRSSEVTAVTRFSAGNPAVREHLVSLQRAVAVGCDIVTEGRDQGTVVFPQAECKIFLTASPGERARRRVGDLLARGESPDYQRVLADLNRRDHQDSQRPVGPLRPAPDAVHVATEGLTVEQVVDLLVELVSTRRPGPRTASA